MGSDGQYTAALESISAKLDQLIRVMDENLHMQKVALLKDGNVLDFICDNETVHLALPNAQRDFIQRVILRSNGFYELRFLRDLQKMNIITPKSVVYDIGANIGNHSVFFSKILKAKKVVAFEPQAHPFSVLQRNLELNDLKGVSAVNSLVGETDGKGEISVFKPHNLGGTEFATAKDGDFAMVSLDGFVKKKREKKIDFLKIDVEGMQMSVFAGAEKVLRDMKPAIWVELLQNRNEYQEAADHLAAFGYSPTQLGPNDFIFQAA